MDNYISKYTGEEIDEAIEKTLSQGISIHRLTIEATKSGVEYRISLIVIDKNTTVINKSNLFDRLNANSSMNIPSEVYFEQKTYPISLVAVVGSKLYLHAGFSGISIDSVHQTSFTIDEVTSVVEDLTLY